MEHRAQKWCFPAAAQRWVRTSMSTEQTDYTTVALPSTKYNKIRIRLFVSYTRYTRYTSILYTSDRSI